jgi:hypothetical protein
VNTIRSRTERGASAVEFALILPLVVLLLFGMVNTGLAYSDHVSVTNAVREGARYGAAVDYTAPNWATSVRDRVRNVYFNDVDNHPLTNAQICVKLVDSGGNVMALPAGAETTWTGSDCGGAPTLPSGMTTGTCAVVVWVRKPRDIELVIAPDLNLNIGGKSVSYYGRTVDGGCTADS